MNKIRIELIAKAKQAALNSYSPYSKFKVGAAVLTERGIFLGTNVENASYGLTLCAERTAISSAIAAGAKEFKAIGLICLDANPKAGVNELTPCGACRQWLLELFPKNAPVYIAGVKQTLTPAKLLPLGFSFK